MDYFAQTMLSEVTYVDKLPASPRGMRGDTFHFKPKEVGEWMGFGEKASGFFRFTLLTSDSRCYECTRVRSAIEDESSFDSFIKQFYFTPLNELKNFGDHLAYYRKNHQRRQEASRMIRSTT